MTIAAILNATADKLAALWPGRNVRLDEVLENADGNFFVSLENMAQTRELGRRYRRTATVDIVYFTEERDNLTYHGWAETMFQNFDTLEVGEQTMHTKNLHAEQVGREFHFLFDVAIGMMFPALAGEAMKQLTYEGGLKDG